MKTEAHTRVESTCLSIEPPTMDTILPDIGASVVWFGPKESEEKVLLDTIIPETGSISNQIPVHKFISLFPCGWKVISHQAFKTSVYHLQI